MLEISAEQFCINFIVTSEKLSPPFRAGKNRLDLTYIDLFKYFALSACI